MTLPLRVACLSAVPIVILTASVLHASDKPVAPSPDERQLPRKMHSQMSELPSVRVGRADADIVGADNRALQAAVDYVANLGGGTVEVGPGEYLMRDSLHLRSNVTARGTPGKTVLRKAGGAASPLAVDGDYGEEQVTLADPTGFDVGCGIAVWDKSSGGFHTTVATITGRRGNTVSICRPLNADCMASNGAQAATVFPVVTGVDLDGVRIEHLLIEGNKGANVNLNGCRGAGIYLYRGFGAVIDHCTVRNFNGDGISFQQSNDVTVADCVSENNAGLGLHPGSGSQRPTVRGCTARGNGEDGLFLCWRVRHGRFEDNVLDANARNGISIGHKDTDNLLRNNRVTGNGADGVLFRNESEGMAAHRNTLDGNVIENNGRKGEVAGIRVRGQTQGLVFRNNTIRDTRAAAERRQTTGVRVEKDAGDVTLDGNALDADTAVKDERAAASAKP
jgi:parallel beta-helix repeat protein